MYSKQIEKLIDYFCSFPGVGPKTGARFVFYILNRMGKQKVEDFGQALTKIKKNLKRCSFCFKYFEPQKDEKLCSVCSDPRREKSVVCIVEEETDLEAIEKNHVYKGLYFILGGTVSDLDKESIKKLRIKELLERIKNPERFGIDSEIKEVILGSNLTVEGDATARFIKRKIKSIKIKTTRLGRGLPQGGELEYADKDTLSSAFKNRR